jgi:hypothetical protein
MYQLQQLLGWFDQEGAAKSLADFRGCGLLPSPESCYCEGEAFSEKKREQLLQYLEAGRYCNKPWPPAVLKSFPSNQGWPTAPSSSSFENCGTPFGQLTGEGGLWDGGGDAAGYGGEGSSDAATSAAAVACSVGVDKDDTTAGWGWGKAHAGGGSSRSDWTPVLFGSPMLDEQLQRVRTRWEKEQSCEATGAASSAGAGAGGAEGGVVDSLFNELTGGTKRTHRFDESTGQWVKDEFQEIEWAQCEVCNKWRRIPSHALALLEGQHFACSMNEWDMEHNSCLADEEEWTASDDVRTNEKLIWLECENPPAGSDKAGGAVEASGKLEKYGLHVQKWVDAYCPRTEQVCTGLCD